MVRDKPSPARRRSPSPSGSRSLIVLVGLGAAAWWALSRGFLHVPVRLEERLEARVAAALLAAGIRDRDVESTLREERRDEERAWIETTRVIRLPPGVEPGDLKTALLRSADRLEADLRLTSGQRETLIEISHSGRRLQKIVLRGPPGPAPGRKVSAGRHKVALVIDDVAGRTEPLERYFNLGIPLTFAVLPGNRGSRMYSRLFAQKNGPYEYILHLPLEPHGFRGGKNDPTLRIAMSTDEKKELLERHLESVPGASGVSNHTGSAFTEDRDSMSLILKELRDRGLFFFDSHTSKRTVAYETAREIGVPAALNRVFLDNKDTVEHIREQLRVLLKIARRRPAAAAIGHFHRKHLAEAIALCLPEFREEGIEFVTLKEVLDAPPKPLALARPKTGR